MYGGGQSTAFRTAEKKYQLHKEQLFTKRKGKRRANGLNVRPVDLSDVIDLQQDGHHPGIACLGVPSGMPQNAAAYSFAVHPGLLVVRGALPPGLQRQLVVEALTLFPEPPNHTNHLKAYPGGLPGIWEAAQQGLRLQHAAQRQQQPAAAGTEAAGTGAAAAGAAARAGGEETVPGGPQQLAPASGSREEVWGAEGSGPTAASLLRRLRWATLGPPYDWTQRLYLRNAPHMPLPAPLHQLAVALADLAAQLLGGSSSGGSCGGSSAEGQQGYCPDAALLNYYHEGDTLTGHIDDAERCLDQPLVSLSLGCNAIFLMGTASKDDPPTALLLRSGDALVLSGPARHCYHGLPRILSEPDRPPAETLRCEGSCGSDANKGGSRGGGGSNTSSSGACAHAAAFAAAAAEDESAFLPFAQHMQRCRINISIRDTR